jgi:hypothetical protein
VIQQTNPHTHHTPEGTNQMTDFYGTPVSACIPGDRTHEFRLPLDRSTIPARTQKALQAVEAARKAVADASGRKEQADANEALRAAVGDLYDRASSTSRADLEHHREGYAYAQARFERAMGEGRAALQLLADHAQQAANPAGVGFPREKGGDSPTVMRLRVITDALTNMPAVPELG